MPLNCSLRRGRRLLSKLRNDVVGTGCLNAGQKAAAAAKSRTLTSRRGHVVPGLRALVPVAVAEDVSSGWIAVSLLLLCDRFPYASDTRRSELCVLQCLASFAWAANPL